ncbi:MAG: AraC family transcriptional regulator [Planctomycetota bacterium]|jgi:AraC family transcriptional regulator
MENAEVWSGTVHLAVTRALYVGPVQDTQPHAHHAIQACFALGEPFGLRADTQDRWQSFDAAIIGANVKHQLDGRGHPHVLVYLEPESTDGRRITEARTSSGIAKLEPSILEAVRSVVRVAGRRGGDVEASRDVFDEVFASLDLAPLSQHPLDARVGLILEELRADPNRYGSISELAAHVGLSPRTFRYLFSREMGISCQRYLVWIRLYNAVRELAAGASITDAAHQVGFADAAYLARTFRRMFGITPSAIRGSISLI